jgi:hypothetical protein
MVREAIQPDQILINRNELIKGVMHGPDSGFSAQIEGQGVQGTTQHVGFPRRRMDDLEMQYMLKKS